MGMDIENMPEIKKCVFTNADKDTEAKHVNKNNSR